MKRVIGMALLAAAAGAGCVALPPLWNVKPKEAVAEPAEPIRAPAPPPVLPDQVSEANAAQALEAIRDELDRAEKDSKD